MLKNYEMSYAERLDACNLISLEERWRSLFVKFARKIVESGRLKHWIKPNESTHEMYLRTKNTFQFPMCRTERYKKSAINCIIKAANEGDDYQLVFE